MTSAAPYASTFIGRARERAVLARRVASHRLVTVVGPLGVGKTRLVAESVQGWARRFPGGRWWLDLASIREPDVLTHVLADRLGLHQPVDGDLSAVLATRLAGQRALLVFDNCEHLLEAVSDATSELLPATASLRILATSREPLGAAGEALLPIGPLPAEDAVRLFVNRAQVRVPDFPSIGQARVEVTRLCERIDNLPLAVELAAARVAHMSPKDMLDRLDRRFDLLATHSRDVPDRHRTLLAALDWSYRLLHMPDQQLLNRLAVLAGDFDLPAAEAVGGPGTLDALGRLIDKSVVVAIPTVRGMRYRLLEAVRAYGLERLAETAQVDAIRDQLLDHFLASVEAAYEERMSSGSDRLLLLLADNADNLRAALEHALASRPDDGLRLAGAMREHWARRNPSEGRLWLHRLTVVHRGRDHALARALLAVGHIMAITEQAYPQGQEALEESRQICSELGDPAGEAWATFYLGAAATLANDFPAAKRHLEQARSMQQANSSMYGLLQARANLGQLLAISGERLMDGRKLLEEVLATSRKLGNRWSSGHAQTFLGLLEIREHNLAAARRQFRPAVDEFEALGDQLMMAAALCGLARSLVPEDASSGMRVAAAANEIHARLGSRFATVWATLLEETRAQAAAELGPASAERAWHSGKRLHVKEAVELEQLKLPATPPAGLTRREAEVARLVAKGLSNRAIAEQLHVSERTAEAHVQHILTKLGLGKRTQVAHWLYEESSTD